MDITVQIEIVTASISVNIGGMPQKTLSSGPEQSQLIKRVLNTAQQHSANGGTIATDAFNGDGSQTDTGTPPPQPPTSTWALNTAQQHSPHDWSFAADATAFNGGGSQANTGTSPQPPLSASAQPPPTSTLRTNTTPLLSAQGGNIATDEEAMDFIESGEEPMDI